jgi:GNAT superfamily N-acetyltransferase
MEFMVLDLEGMDVAKKQAYKLLTEPAYRCCLDNKSPDEFSFVKIVAIGVENQGTPIALSLASVYEGLDYSDLHSLYVFSPFRSQGIGGRLLGETEKALFSSDCHMICANYRKNDPTSSHLEHLFERHHWQKPQLQTIRYFYDAQVFNPPWYQRPPPLPKGYTEFPWHKLKATERNQILKDFHQGHFSSHVSPFQEEGSIDPNISVGLRYKNQVIGWMICHRIAHDTIRYTAFYVKPEFCFTGYPVRLLVDAMALHQKSTVKWALFEINLHDVHPSWLKFVHKRLAPYSQSIVKINSTWKSIPS